MHDHVRLDQQVYKEEHHELLDPKTKSIHLLI
jgi:hypothetical protein